MLKTFEKQIFGCWYKRVVGSRENRYVNTSGQFFIKISHQRLYNTLRLLLFKRHIGYFASQVHFD